MIYSADIDHCESNPCHNSGTCTDRLNGFICTCRFGFHGSRCETSIKAAKYQTQKPSTCPAAWVNLLRDKLWVWWKTSNKNKVCYSNWDPRSTFCHKFLQPAKNVFATRQVDHAKWKTGNIDPKLATKQCCATRWEFLRLLFCCLYQYFLIVVLLN